jgi:hypothetical protein
MPSNTARRKKGVNEMSTKKINATPSNRATLRSHAREALRDYSPVMTWLLLDDDGDLYEITELQGQTYYTGRDDVIGATGGFAKAHGDGAARNEDGQKYRSQRDYLSDILGKAEYARIFAKN